MIKFTTCYKNGIKREFKKRQDEGVVKGREKNQEQQEMRRKKWQTTIREYSQVRFLT